jgi:hypothetical protein
MSGLIKLLIALMVVSMIANIVTVNLWQLDLNEKHRKAGRMKK